MAAQRAHKFFDVTPSRRRSLVAAPRVWAGFSDSLLRNSAEGVMCDVPHQDWEGM